MPYPCSHFYFDINFGNRLYSKENRPGSPLLFWIQSVAKFDIKVKVSNMGDKCNIWEKVGWLFTIHYFTNSNQQDILGEKTKMIRYYCQP